VTSRLTLQSRLSLRKPDGGPLRWKAARNLVLELSWASGQTKFAGFQLLNQEVKAFPTFYFVSATWNDPNNTPKAQHYAIDRYTGAVWDAVLCEQITSPSFVKLQQAIHKTIGLTQQEYRKIRRPGPMCDPGDKPRLRKG
jgi:hypothetical protein